MRSMIKALALAAGLAGSALAGEPINPQTLSLPTKGAPPLDPAMRSSCCAYPLIFSAEPSSLTIILGVETWFVMAGSKDATLRGSAVTIFPDGSIIFGPKFKGDADAQRFWVEMAKAAPGMFQRAK